jgi:PAS domain S-box-containing protein
MSQDDEEAVHPNAVEVSPAPITIYDAEGILRYVNPAAVAFANADSADEVVGRPASEFVHPADREEIGRRIEQVIAEREPTEPTEFRFIALDGEEKYAETAGTPMTYEGEPAGQAILNDITERKRAQRKLQRQNERLEELVSAMAHDLRNPLHVANASVELLETDVESDALDRLARAHERMEAIIEDILALAEQGEPITDPEPVDLGTVATRAWETSRTGDADLAVADSRRFRADSGRVQELFENLFGNAAEHGGPEVTVTVGATGDGFYVADDGPGIPGEERDRIFESGYSTATDGTGFGLTIVRRIAEAHGWSVELTESKTGGARFEFTGVDGVS